MRISPARRALDALRNIMVFSPFEWVTWLIGGS
jgi:hypothetical protein